VPVTVALGVRDTLTLPETVGVADGDRVPRALAVSLGEPVAELVPRGDADCEALTAADGVTGGDADPEAEPVGERDPGPERELDGEAVDERRHGATARKSQFTAAVVAEACAVTRIKPSDEPLRISEYGDVDVAVAVHPVTICNPAFGPAEA